VFYSKTKITEPPTGSLALKGAVFQQVEGVALIKGGEARPAAEKFIEFMRSASAQESLQTEMWMFAAEPGTAKAEAMKYAIEPSSHQSVPTGFSAEKNAEWISRWTKTVLK
jgi:thiamine transport system substrate-binding protein